MAKTIPKYVVDTNVPIYANHHTRPEKIPDDEVECVLACVQHIRHIIDNGKKGLWSLVVDAGEEIFEEYRKHLNLSGQEGLGDAFMKWVHDYRWRFPQEDRVTITKNSSGYEQFPDDPVLKGFDPSDKKFVAVANAHPSKPPILVASDHKWWTFREHLKQQGIVVQFLCPDQIKEVSNRKKKKKTVL